MRRPTAIAAAGMALAAVLSGCGTTGDSGSGTTDSGAPPATARPAGTTDSGTAVPGTMDGASAAQIEDAVTQAQSTLDHLDTEIQGDSAALTP